MLPESVGFEYISFKKKQKKNAHIKAKTGHLFKHSVNGVKFLGLLGQLRANITADKDAL